MCAKGRGVASAAVALETNVRTWRRGNLRTLGVDNTHFWYFSARNATLTKANVQRSPRFSLEAERQHVLRETQLSIVRAAFLSRLARSSAASYARSNARVCMQARAATSGELKSGTGGLVSRVSIPRPSPPQVTVVLSPVLKTGVIGA